MKILVIAAVVLLALPMSISPVEAKKKSPQQLPATAHQFPVIGPDTIHVEGSDCTADGALCFHAQATSDKPDDGAFSSPYFRYIVVNE